MVAEDPLKEFIELARRLEECGYSTIWITDEQLYRNCYVYLALCSLNTSKVRLGTAVTNPVTRHPAITAEAIGTIDELSDGRAVLGLGIGGSILRMLKLKSSISALREAIFLIRRLLAGETISYEGEHFRLHNAQSSFRTRKDIPIFIAASGPKTLELAGAIADGAIVHVGTSPEALRFALGTIGKGIDEAGRNPRGICSVCWVRTCISQDAEEARDEVRLQPAWLLANTPLLAKLVGISETEAAEIGQIYWKDRFKPNGKARIKRMVTEEMIDKFTLAGTPEDCIKKIRLLAREGISQIAFETVGRSRNATIKALIEEVMPALQE